MIHWPCPLFRIFFIYKHRRCSSSRNSLRGIHSPITHSHILSACGATYSFDGIFLIQLLFWNLIWNLFSSSIVDCTLCPMIFLAPIPGRVSKHQMWKVTLGKKRHNTTKGAGRHFRTKLMSQYMNSSQTNSKKWGGFRIFFLQITGQFFFLSWCKSGHATKRKSEEPQKWAIINVFLKNPPGFWTFETTSWILSFFWVFGRIQYIGTLILS